MRLALADGREVEVTADLVDVRVSAKEGGVFVILDTLVTGALAAEGLAREFVSKVQQARKQLDLEMMDRILVEYEGDMEVRAALEEWGGYICGEVLADEVVCVGSGGGEGSGLSGGEGLSEVFDLNGHRVRIGVRVGG